MAWQSLGAVTVGPSDRATSVGSLELPAGADTLWIRAQQLGGISPWPFSYGLVYWLSADGRELGTAKVFGHQEGEVCRLGVGLSPVERAGVLWFEPRSFNLQWIKASGTTWSLGFEWQAGTSTAGDGGGGVSGFAGGFVTTAGQGLTLARVVFP